MTIGYTRDEIYARGQRQKKAIYAQSVRAGLLTALIVYAVITVTFSPQRRNQK
jgi:hypothetical protein